MSEQQINFTETQYQDKLYVLVFYADWDTKSMDYVKQLQEPLNLFSQFIRYYFVDIDANTHLAHQFQINYVPAVQFTDFAQQPLLSIVNQTPEYLLEEIERYLPVFEINHKIDQQTYRAELDYILKNSKITIFYTILDANTRNFLEWFDKKQIRVNYMHVQQSNFEQWLCYFAKCSSFPQVYVDSKLYEFKDLSDQLIPEECKQDAEIKKCFLEKKYKGIQMVEDLDGNQEIMYNLETDPQMREYLKQTK